MTRKPANITFSPTDLRLLRIFQAVVRHEGFAAAQDELGLTPGTISNHITHLETRFGVRLCERGRRGFSLTADGVRIHEAGESLLRSVENFASIVGSVRGELAGTVHLGTVDAMHTNDEAPLDRAIAKFSGLAPKVMLHVEIASPQDLLQRLLDGRYSVILTPTADPHPSVVSIPLYDEEQRLYCGKNHPLYDIAGELSLAAVRKQPYVGRTYMQGLNNDRDSGFDHRAMTSHMEAIAILIKSGRYLGYLPVHFAQPFVERLEMTSLLDHELSYNDTFSLVLRKDERNRATMLLSRCLQEELGKNASAL
ncbi:LysR family transcriptional regulator [Aestuariivirga sp.]|uniref:LysR family transcriptional regulator n=1 Tax=Aestuariivirga sp. TaxID=2650926 RepID=UPI003593C81A